MRIDWPSDSPFVDPPSQVRLAVFNRSRFRNAHISWQSMYEAHWPGIKAAPLSAHGSIPPTRPRITTVSPLSCAAPRRRALAVVLSGGDVGGGFQRSKRSPWRHNAARDKRSLGTDEAVESRVSRMTWAFDDEIVAWCAEVGRSWQPLSNSDPTLVVALQGPETSSSTAAGRGASNSIHVQVHDRPSRYTHKGKCMGFQGNKLTLINTRPQGQVLFLAPRNAGRVGIGRTRHEVGGGCGRGGLV